VVPPPLQHLGEEALDPPTVSRDGRVKEHEPRLRRQRGSSRCHVAPPGGFRKGEDLALCLRVFLSETA
jgi:hypothetical protein